MTKNINIWNPSWINAENQHIEYKLEKNPAVLNLERLAKAYCQVPRWLLLILSLIVVFLILSLLSSIVLLLVKQPNRGYNETCHRFECMSSLGLHCLDEVCACLPHEHYTNRCVRLGSYEQVCRETRECEPGLVCRNSACNCTNTEYWNNSSCVRQNEHNHMCWENKQCRSDLNLVCNLSQHMCECINPEKNYWNGKKCSKKGSINEDCSSTSGCLETSLLECSNNNGKCVCAESHYWNEDESRCEERFGEYHPCTSDAQCMSPMFCSARGHCSCRHFHFHNVSRTQCLPKYVFNESCEFSSQCRQDFGLECSSYTCRCHETLPVWSVDDNRCAAALDLGKSCSAKSAQHDCNRDKNLVCNPEINRCECEKVKDREKFWNGTECLPAKSYGETCHSDMECQTITQGTRCDEDHHTCTCVQPGGYTTKSRCLQCRSGEIYFADSCYFISTTANKRDDAQNHCNMLGGNLAKAESIAHIRFFAANLLNDYYWLSGRRRNATYYWLPSSVSLASDRLCPEFSSGTTDNYDYECLYFDSKPTTECYRPANCNNLYRYVCEIRL